MFWGGVLAFKLVEKDRLKRRSRYVPKIYVVHEPPVTIEYDGRRYECKELLQSPQGLLCVQYDNTVLVLPQQAQQQSQQQQQFRAQLV